MARMTTEWQVERVSERFNDNSLNNYDDLQIELVDEKFKPAPPISVAEYKARTSEVIRGGIFDEIDVPKSSIAGEGTRYEDLMDKDVFGPISEESFQVQVLYGIDRAGNADELKRPTNEKKNNAENHFEDNSSKKPENAKKKKKKFKPFNLHSSAHPPKNYEEPWTPNFSRKFKNDEEFPPL